MIDKYLLLGRRLLLSELPYSEDELEEEKDIKSCPAMIKERLGWKCLRCGSIAKWTLGREGIVYCTECLMLGRVTNRDFLYTYVKKSGNINKNLEKKLMCWDGRLSLGQLEASEQIVKAIEQGTDLLIHAVTGAGKTEMLFKGIELALGKGLKVGVASPRVDVCLELFPRFQKVFPTTHISLLHGGQEDSYFYSLFVVLTCHQLFRFYHAFDVLIIDEVDAFPYVGNSELEYATKQSLNIEGVTIFLSATPTYELFSRVTNGSLNLITIPNRYHGYALPEPKIKWLWKWKENVRAGTLPYSFERLLRDKASKRRRLLIFCPSIALLKKIVELSRCAFPEIKQGFSYATDNNRIQKVQMMREELFEWFFTSTILERGVTFSDIDVIVIGSEHIVFTKHSLIQIAGRAGRSQSDPFGEVYFFSEGLTRSMFEAKKEIIKMNQLARKRGLLK